MPELLAPSLAGAELTRQDASFAAAEVPHAVGSVTIPSISDEDATIARREADSIPAGLEVAVLIVCHNGLEYLTDCLNSVLGSDDGPLKVRFVVVDNASSDGSAQWVAGRFGRVDLVRRRENLGFAGGNNAGWEYIRRRYPKVQYIALLNQDTVVQTGWLAALVAHLEKRPTVATFSLPTWKTRICRGNFANWVTTWRTCRAAWCTTSTVSSATGGIIFCWSATGGCCWGRITRRRRCCYCCRRWRRWRGGSCISHGARVFGKKSCALMPIS